MIRLSMLNIHKLFGALSKHGYKIELEDGIVVDDIIDNEDATAFTINNTKYKAKDKLYIQIYKPLTKKKSINLLVNLL